MVSGATNPPMIADWILDPDTIEPIKPIIILITTNCTMSPSIWIPFIQARKNASAKHEEFKMILSEIHVINKKLGSSKNRKRRSDKSSGSSNNKKNREEKERAESIFDKFKNGKKLSTEELLLLQKYDIN